MKYLSLSLTGEGVATSRRGWAHHMSLSVLYYKIGNLVQEHGAEVVLLQEVVRCQPGVLRHIVRQLHGRPSLVHIDGEHVVVLLGEDQEKLTSTAGQVWFTYPVTKLITSHLPFIHHTLGGLLVRASDHITDFHPAAITDTPLIRLHLLSIFN